MYYDDDVSQGSGCVRGALILAVVGIAIAGFFYFSVNRATKNLFPTIPNPIAARPTTVDASRPAVIQSIKALNKLETTTYIAEKVIQAGQQGNAVYNLFLGDKLLLIAHGDVIAGFDLSRLRDQDIVVGDNGTSVTLTLPPAEVLSYKLDNSKTVVYERQTGVATKGNTGLETEARRIAEQEILRAACDGGVIDQANINGQHQMEVLLKNLKFTQVTVKTQAGACTLPGGAPLPPPPAAPQTGTQ